MQKISTDKSQDKPFGIILTGFGPFGKVTQNPTTFLIEHLPVYLSQNLKIDYKLLDARIITVDIQSCDRALQEINEIIQQNESICSKILVLHLGVYSGIKTFNLECQACNNETFFIPDQAGNRPVNQPIDSLCPLNSLLSCSVDVVGLQSVLSKEGFSCKVSNNAGRYICNYIYYCSLQRLECEQENVHSMFVHVGNFKDVGKQVQLNFFWKLCKYVFEMIS